ncbi:MAG: thiosulfate oxidation carrier protein SoxY [Burkholderiales bacterium]|nr:thiosulfate oxidation carrier protein SoxY [Burkholderiales bacterium]
MSPDRRTLLRHASSAGVMSALMAWGGWPAQATAQTASGWNKAAFDGQKLDEVLAALGGTKAEAAGDVVLLAPDIAENGAVVPFTITSKLPGTKRIALLVEKNPTPLIAVYDLADGTLAEIQVRAKMAQTSNVYALVDDGRRRVFAVKEVKVTLGGCGG